MRHENKIQKSILKYLKDLKDVGEPIFFERRQAGGLSYKKGIPDVYAVYNGVHIEIEVKDPGGSLTTMQEKFRDLCKKININYICATSLDDFIEYLNEIKGNFI